MYRIAVILAFIITFPYIGNAQQKRAGHINQIVRYVKMECIMAHSHSM